MSSYPVLYDKPIDQWKVTELKEELKRRRLTTKGLKDDLIRRLDESLQMEIEIANKSAGKGLAFHPEPVQYQDASVVAGADEKSSAIFNKSGKDTELNSNVTEPNVDVNMGLMAQEPVVEVDTLEPVTIAETAMESIVQETTLDMTVQVTTVETKLKSGGHELQNNGAQSQSEALDIQMQDEKLDPSHELAKLSSSDLETQVFEVNKVKSDSISTDNVPVNEKIEDLNIQPQNEESNPHQEEANPNSFALETQVYEVSKVTSDSISTDNISINEKLELKDNIIAADVKLEFDVKHIRQEPSSGHVGLDDGGLQPMDVKGPQENEVKFEVTGTNADDSNLEKKNHSGDVEFSKTSHLDRSSGDNSIEDGILESKQTESISLFVESSDKIERREVTVAREQVPVVTMVDDTRTDGKTEQKNVPDVASTKRKPHDQGTVGNFDTAKKQRRWNNEGLKVLEPNNDNASPSITPRGTFQSNAKHTILRPDPMASVETPKERVVPPSSRSPTSALRIDRFLRPFTLKAVQELLGKTGTVTKFWMDHIKTHCYVNFSSIEEAIETRNAVYNLQWPANGGRLLVAEFVEPQEVQMRIEAPHSPAASVNTVPILPAVPTPMQSQPYPRVQVLRKAPPPLPVLPRPPPTVSNPLAGRERGLHPPPPTVSNSPAARERALPPPPPPPVSNPSAAREQDLSPPPLPERVMVPEKVDPPVVTLDDLFRKTRATPRIYYLPLSDEQVKAKENAHGKPSSSRD
ncbi:hypothetical protein DCAR_0100971 [Daucus carota subsp. sativus]|uniref:SAP domain-containing protein n=1 Tax=Daucus carota subsp. sativus TaxID=79200 RepID=A0A166G2E4_DAUCS|nr:PREDICTED: uncharacterized protein LOC108204286 isoform X2 [Daucus carota subsp. sativus]WOG81820.1 hypothetical protein DCAR_0100971 [Daucus carota subsp. sativus]